MPELNRLGRATTSTGRAMRKVSPTAPKCDVTNPCRICGWSEHMAIHQPILTGARAGQPAGHTYMPESKKGNP
ncbi:hypothetical protein ABL850_14965 [Variovorax paradoxus]|uniref:hypothetical protein n=1 Tax=Variovorax paradoxus TaxID=34073 RepID=UPI003AAAB00D